MSSFAFDPNRMTTNARPLGNFDPIKFMQDLVDRLPSNPWERLQCGVLAVDWLLSQEASSTAEQLGIPKIPANGILWGLRVDVCPLLPPYALRFVATRNSGRMDRYTPDVRTIGLRDMGFFQEASQE